MKIVAFGAWGVHDLYNALYQFGLAGIRVDAVVCAKAKQVLSDLTLQRAGNRFVPRAVEDLGGAFVPFYFVKNHNDHHCHELLEMLQPDLVINLGTPNILRTEALNLPRVGVLNCHPGWLPDYRGCTCVEWAIYNGDPVAATCHFMTEGIDEGPIIVQRVMPVVPGTEYAQIRAEMVDHQAKTMIEGIQRIAAEGLSKASLPSQGEGRYYRVIPDELMSEIKEKTRNGGYRSDRSQGLSIS